MPCHEIVRCDPLCLELTWITGLLTHSRLRWSRPGDESRSVTVWHQPLAAWLSELLTGSRRPCPQIPLDWEQVSGFSSLVLSVLQEEVQAGHWISYGGLAQRCGRPLAARAVGRAMAANPWPLIVPCHRVLGGAGQLTGFGGGLDIKVFLLKTEGVRFSPSGQALQEDA